MLCPLNSCGRVAGVLSAAISPVVAQAGPADPVPLRPALVDRDFALSRVFPPRLKRLEAPDLKMSRLPLPVLGDLPFEFECFHLHLLGDR